MFSLSKISLSNKKNSEINLVDFKTTDHFSLLCVYQSSSSSDTGNLYFIQQNLDDNGFKIKKLVWITDSPITAFSINPTCDWIAIAYRGGLICILPLGTLMGRIQKKNEHWKPNDVTYLQNQSKSSSSVTCMKWWTSFKERNACIVGKSDNILLIIDLNNGSTLYMEKFNEAIKSIDLLTTKDKTLSYCIITTEHQNQSKLLLEEIHDRRDISDTEFGFDILDFSAIHSSSIIYPKSSNKSKGKPKNTIHLPSKLYQFPKSTILKSQYYNGKYYLGAYDSMTGKYKLFDCCNLDSPLYEFLLPLYVVNICVTEDLIFLILGSNEEHLTSSNKNSIFKEKQTLKLCVVFRQYAHSRNLEKSKTLSIKKKRSLSSLLRLFSTTSVPDNLSKYVLMEFDLPEVYSSDDILAVLNFSAYFNFSKVENNIVESSNSLLTTSSFNFTQKPRKNSVLTTLTNEQIYSKWGVADIKAIAPIFIITSSGISVCYMGQPFEDKFIDQLLSYDIASAEWLGAGLKLDMNELYKYTAQLLVNGNAQLAEHVVKSKKSVILEYFELASAPIKIVLASVSHIWSPEKCLLYTLSQLVHINKMTPSNRMFLSNAIIPIFAQVMSDPFDSIEGTEKKRNKYHDKFRRFVVGNFFFNDLKAAKIMFQFGLIDEAFFIAKEKGCVLDLFNFIIENGYSTKWFDHFPDLLTRGRFMFYDIDNVLNSIGLVELEIIARNEPKFIKSLAEFVCSIGSDTKVSISYTFSFQTISHLCAVFNPYGCIIDTLFRIYASTNSPDFQSSINRNSDVSKFNKNIVNSTDSMISAGRFSETLKIRREIGPEILTYCLLVSYKDNKIQDVKNYIYFIHIYDFINSSYDKQDSNTKRKLSETEKSKSISPFNADSSFISWNTKFKLKRNILSPFWTKNVKSKLLYLRDELCVSITVLDIDLFDDGNEDNSVMDTILYKINRKLEEKIKPKTSFSETKPSQKCQIKLLGFNKENSNRILLLPKNIETGKEIIRQVSLGKNHVLILTESGALYGAGSNHYGQLGFANHILKQSVSTGRQQCLTIINPLLINVDLYDDEIILSVTTGDYHSGIIVVSTASKKQISHIFTWGWGVHGQLGHGDTNDQNFPKRLIWNYNDVLDFNKQDFEEFPIEMSMGCYHSVMLTNKGRVYTFGNNSFGQLGEVGLQKSLSAIHVKSLPENVTHIDTKYFHTACCTSSNEIYAWGIHPNLWQNAFNNHKSQDCISTPEKIDTDHLLDNEIISQISCGSSHTTILTESKLVYSFGSNIWGQLGLGNRKDINKLVEVKLPNQISYISSDDGLTIAMNVSEKYTKLFVWGRCSHSLVQEHVKNLMCDTVKPQILHEYPNVIDNNLLRKHCFGMDSVLNGVSRVINKQQLMIIFLNFSKFIDRDKFLSLFTQLEEYDVIADYFLVNDLIIQSLFWRIKSLINRLSNKIPDDKSDIITDDIQLIFKFYILLTDNQKYKHWKKSILSMITGFFKQHNLSWTIYENIVCSLLSTNAFLVASHFVKFSLESSLSSNFIREMLLFLIDENLHEFSFAENLERIDLSSKDINRFFDLVKSGSVDTIYDAADDHKVVFFSTCGHASVIGRYRDQQLKMFVDKLRKRQLNLSSQMIQRLYNDSSIFPDCLDCLSQALRF